MSSQSRDAQILHCSLRHVYLEAFRSHPIACVVLRAKYGFNVNKHALRGLSSQSSNGKRNMSDVIAVEVLMRLKKNINHIPCGSKQHWKSLF